MRVTEELFNAVVRAFNFAFTVKAWLVERAFV
jgi:hypothetical protein